DAMLTEVHRQAEGNPIIRLSMDIRNGVPIKHGEYGPLRVLPWQKGTFSPQDVLAADQVLVGKNDTRHGFNKRIRKLKKLERETPLIGERLVCLRNDRDKGLFNGGLWIVTKIGKFNPEAVHLTIRPEDSGDMGRTVRVKVHPDFFEHPERSIPWETLRDGKYQ